MGFGQSQVFTLLRTFMLTYSMFWYEVAWNLSCLVLVRKPIPTTFKSLTEEWRQYKNVNYSYKKCCIIFWCQLCNVAVSSNGMAASGAFISATNVTRHYSHLAGQTVGMRGELPLLPVSLQQIVHLDKNAVSSEAGGGEGRPAEKLTTRCRLQTEQWKGKSPLSMKVHCNSTLCAFKCEGNTPWITVYLKCRSDSKAHIPFAHAVRVPIYSVCGAMQPARFLLQCIWFQSSKKEITKTISQTDILH